MPADEHPVAAPATLADTAAAPAEAAVPMPQLTLAAERASSVETPLPRQPWTTRLPQPLRVVAHGWWKVFSFLFVGNYVAGLVFAFLQGGWSALVTTLTSWGFLAPLERTQPIIFWTGLGVLAALALAGLTEELAERRAGVDLAARQVRRIEEAHQTAQSAQEVAQSAQATAERALSVVTVSAPIPQPLGPPDDVALLPTPTPFVGRADDLAWVEDRLRAPEAGGAYALTALRGLGGIGKSALAGVAVRQLQQEGRFPDGIAVVPCQRLTDPAEVLRRVLIRFDPLRRAPEVTELPQLQDATQAILRGK